MAYETGTVTNSHSLVTKIWGLLIDAGWERVATLKTGITNPAPDGYDFVLYSTGTSGNDDIYIRIAAGESDQVANGGDIQHPYTDGYTEYINVFAYQHFPSSGTSPEDGCNELGKYGPTLYVAEDAGATGRLYEYNMLKSTAATPRWRNVSDFTANVSPKTSAFDGRRYVYQYVVTNNSLNRIDLFDGSVASKAYNGLSTNGGGTPYVRHSDGTEYIYRTSNQTGVGQVMNRYNVASDGWTTSGIDNPPWDPSNGTAGCMCVGPRRKRQDSNYWLYLFRGGTSGGDSTKWAQFDLDSKRWTSEISPDAPWTVGNWTSWSPFCLYVTKEQSGYEHDRIYLWRGNSYTNFASIAIDDDGYVPSGDYGIWALHTATPFGQYDGVNAVCVGGTIISSAGAGESQAVTKFVLPEDPTALGSWTTIDDDWLQYNHNNSPNVFNAHHHLCGRVRVSEFETNTYWAFADKDRVVIVVKNARGDYEYSYVGKFAPYANPINTTLVERVPGGSTSIKVSDPTFFEAGKTYMIVDTTGDNNAVVTSDFSGVSKRLAASETFTVVSNDNSGTLLISALHSDYWAGSKVGEDPVPIMVRAHGIEKAQTFDTINLVDADGYTDFAWQTYSLMPTVSDAFADATDLSERSLETYLYGIVLINEGDSYVGKEVRGQMIGVYSCGTGIASEAEVEVGSKKYLAFDIADSGQVQRIVVGPTE